MPIPRNVVSLLFLFLVVALSGCSTPPWKTSATQTSPATTQVSTGILQQSSFAAIPGWQTDELKEAWPAFLASCQTLSGHAGWRQPCAAARKVKPADAAAIRAYFELHFVPQQASGQNGIGTGLMTGYYEPLLRGARKRGGPYQTPLHRKPDDLLSIDSTGIYPELKGMRLRGRLVGKVITPYPSRAEIASSNLLRGKELLWVEDPIEAFFLQVQGSGRVHLADSGTTVRVAYADQNGHPYKSIGRYLADKGEISLDQASAQGIKAWLAANPSRQSELLNANPSYVFFKEEPLPHPGIGPKGALGVPLTAERSIAVDPNHIALGTPVFIVTTHPGTGKPLQRLTVAQDTGSAIKGANRIDYFWGFGNDARDNAGKTKHAVTLWLLVPRHAS
jgi:membrane-bound lytic murein transglycosylase A